ncbi:MAG: 4Fe-4S ferredoxin, partial [Desulfobacterales bacterium]
MSAQICPVHQTVTTLSEMIDTGQLKIPRNRWTAEEIRTLINDIAWGNAGAEHLPTVDAKVQQLKAECTDDACRKVADFIEAAVSQNREVFSSHIDTHNCPTGECVKLAPAPCQMTCPAGLDIPTYVTLIGLGRDAEAIDVIRKDCPFPWVCGLVCTRPCEFMCVRARIDTSIA